ARALVPGASVDEALDALAARYPMVALKRGPAGATLTIGGRRLEAPARAIRVMDSTGAGDSFAAAFIARLSLGATASAALAAAIRAGTRACRRLGAQ
ncbi:MAG: ribokinase, partial [Hyphomicrobiales bacterium]|nr:ribokinase [Hyphomicrobiales bacterium]